MLHRLCINLILLLLITVSCNKDEKNKIHIEGKIYDPNTEEYVSNVLVTISASKLSSGGIFSSGYDEIASITTDANGTFIFDFQEDKFAGFRITAIREGYFNFFKELSTSEIIPGTTFLPTYYLYPVCYIDMKIKNIAPYDENDLISYSFTSGWLGGFECCDNTIHQGSGENFSDTVFCKTYGNQYVTVTYNVTKEGNTLLFTQTKYCQAFDTTYFNIQY